MWLRWPSVRRSGETGVKFGLAGQTAQGLCGGVQIWLGPGAAAIDCRCVADRDQPYGTRRLCRGIHKVEIAGPASRNDREAMRHRLIHHQAIAFGAMQRQQHIGVW